MDKNETNMIFFNKRYNISPRLNEIQKSIHSQGPLKKQTTAKDNQSINFRRSRRDRSTGIIQFTTRAAGLAELE